VPPFFKVVSSSTGRIGLSLLLSFALTLTTASVSAAQASINLDQATIEDLLNIEVTSASKKEQGLFRTAAAVHVVTREDIRRSGATSIPEVLRLVPGLQVARIDGHTWAVSSRGFNSLWSNKLLVLVDGRVVYTPVTSGVEWDLLETMLADVDRIEVVRGPGASVWGANAVNGVINIITKTAGATQGGLVSLESGSVTPGVAAFRYGGPAGSRGHYRVFGQHSQRAAMKDDEGLDAADWSRLSSAGFRIDVDQDNQDAWTVVGSLLTGETSQRIYRNLASYEPVQPSVVVSSSPVTTGHLLARWTRTAPTSSMSMQTFWDRSNRVAIGIGQVTQTFDVEFQHRFKAADRHDVNWGTGLRWWSDREGAAFATFLDPQHSRRRLLNVFVQDEIQLPGPRLYLTVGTKVEFQTNAGLEIQPTVRIAWLPTPRQTAWAAISRAARTPSRLERSLHYDYAAFPDANGQLIVLGVRGNPDLLAEHTVSTEAGYRVNPGFGVSFEGTAYHNRYSALITENMVMRFEETPAPAHVAVVRQLSSGMSGESVGVELLVRWRPTRVWAMDASTDWFHSHHHDVGDTVEARTLRDRDPARQIRLRSQLNLPHSFQVDAAWTHIARLAGIGIPAYDRVDVRIGGTFAGVAVSLTGQNLLADLHHEFGGFEGVFFSQVPRSWVARATWGF
jgi:iron complex outermembrane receptor protein